DVDSGVERHALNPGHTHSQLRNACSRFPDPNLAWSSAASSTDPVATPAIPDWHPRPVPILLAHVKWRTEGVSLLSWNTPSAFKPHFTVLVCLKVVSHVQ